MKDLIVLAADKNAEFAMRSILQRLQSLRIREISYDIRVHPHHDPGIYKTSHDFLRIFISKYSYALVMLDKEGCGCSENSYQIAQEIQEKLNSSGWQDRSKVIVLDPELEIWVWSDSPQVARCLGWDNADLREWLLNEGHLLPDALKPEAPKLIMEKALKAKNKPRSSSIYGRLAARVSLNRCTDVSFLEFKQILNDWFSVS